MLVIKPHTLCRHLLLDQLSLCHVVNSEWVHECMSAWSSTFQEHIWMSSWHTRWYLFWILCWASTVVIACWNTPGLLLRAMGITYQWYTPCGLLNAIYFLDAFASGACNEGTTKIKGWIVFCTTKGVHRADLLLLQQRLIPSAHLNPLSKPKSGRIRLVMEYTVHAISKQMCSV